MVKSFDLVFDRRTGGRFLVDVRTFPVPVPSPFMEVPQGGYDVVHQETKATIGTFLVAMIDRDPAESGHSNGVHAPVGPRNVDPPLRVCKVPHRPSGHNG